MVLLINFWFVGFSFGRSQSKERSYNDYSKKMQIVRLPSTATDSYVSRPRSFSLSDVPNKKLYNANEFNSVSSSVSSLSAVLNPK